MSISLFMWVQRRFYAFFSSFFNLSTTPAITTQHAAKTHAKVGRRLVPTIIDENAEEQPGSCVFMISRAANFEDGFDVITWLQFANVINFVARWIEESLGRSCTFETIAFFGAKDFEYAVITVAAQKAGYKVFFSSLWNDLETHLHLLKSSDCNIIITSTDQATLVADITTKKRMKHLRIPDLTEVLNGPLVPVYPFTSAFEEAQAEPFAVFHTSGSTGFPKIITITHGAMAACDAFQNAHTVGYARTHVGIFKGKRVFSGVPPCHAAGTFHVLAMPTFYGSIPVIGATNAPTPTLVSQILKYGHVNILILRPDVLGRLADDPYCLDQFESLDYVMNAACVLPKYIGDKIAAKTSLMSYMGATETLLVPFELLDQQDWDFFAPSKIFGAEFRHHNADLYELIIVRQPHLMAYQAIFYTFPHIREYSMKDLYSKHPTKPHLWRYRGRVDDVVQLSNGRKILPEPMETRITNLPNVRTAVVLGQAREEPALLIEPQEEPPIEDRTQLLNSISQSLEIANQASPEHARVSAGHVLFTSSAKPLVRSVKGAVQRAVTSKVYEEELDQLGV